MRNGPIRMGASLARKYGSVNAWPFGTQALGGLHDAMRVFADVDGHAWADMSGEAVMIQMGMGDEHADQSVVSVREAGNRRQQIFVWPPSGASRGRPPSSAIRFPWASTSTHVPPISRVPLWIQIFTVVPFSVARKGDACVALYPTSEGRGRPSACPPHQGNRPSIGSEITGAPYAHRTAP